MSDAKSPMKVLIIDDEVEFASTLCQRLRLRNIEAAEAHGGREGIAALVAIEPDVVILDLKMIDMSGLDVLEKIKQHNPAVEVIMLTGHGSVRSGVRAKEKGASDYIMKPVELQELLEKISKAVRKRYKE